MIAKVITGVDQTFGALFSKRWESCFTEKISFKRQMSADGAADLRRRAAPSARTRHGGDDIDAAEAFRLRAKPAPRFLFSDEPIFFLVAADGCATGFVCRLRRAEMSRSVIDEFR